MGFLGFIFQRLLWRRAIEKQQQKLDKVTADLGNSEVIAELAERDPAVREALRTLGVQCSRAQKPKADA